MTKKTSSRKDGRGGWLAGKRRHPDGGQWSRTRIDLSALLDEHFARGMISARALAAALGVSDRAVRRWLDGTDRPAPETQLAVRRWISDRRAEIKAARA